MFKSRLYKAALAVAISASMAGGGMIAANAIASQTNFTTIVPRLQQSHYWQYQNRTTTSDSQVRFSTIGASYLMNVKAQNGDTQVQYQERKAIGVGSTVTIKNGTPIDTATRLIVTNNTWALFDVVATGWFRTN